MNKYQHNHDFTSANCCFHSKSQFVMIEHHPPPPRAPQPSAPFPKSLPGTMHLPPPTQDHNTDQIKSMSSLMIRWQLLRSMYSRSCFWWTCVDCPNPSASYSIDCNEFRDPHIDMNECSILNKKTDMMKMMMIMMAIITLISFLLIVSSISRMWRRESTSPSPTWNWSLK